MKPIKLHIKDFCSHSNTEINFDNFNCALIIGKKRGNDRCSNGSGKSSIFSAINYVLFNETSYSSLDKVIRNNTDACKVSFDFVSSLDNQIYRIVRSRHRKTGSEVRLFRQENNDWTDLTARTNSQTEQEIHKILKINYNTFCNSAFFGQSDLSGIASLTPSQRKKSLKSILQLDAYAKYEAAAKRRTSELLKEIEKTKTILSTIGAPETDIKTFNDELTHLHTHIENKNVSLSFLKEKHILENSKCDSLIKELEHTEQNIIEYNSKYRLLEIETTKLCNSVKEYDRKISSIKDMGSSLIKEVKDIKVEISNIDITKLRTKDIIKQDIESLSKNIIEKKALINSFNSKLNELKIPLPSGGSCKHCRRIITESEVKSCQEAIDQEIKYNTIKIKTTQEEISFLSQQDRNLKDELQQTENTFTKLENKKQATQNKEKEIETKKLVFVEFNDLLEKANIEYKNKQQELQNLTLSKPQDNSEQIKKLKTDIIESKSRVNGFLKEIDGIDKELQTISNSIAVLNHKIEQRTKDIEKIKEFKNTISELERKYVIHSKVVSAFGSKGIPALITQTILDDFMFETNIFLSKLYQGIQMQFIVEKERTDGEIDDTLDMQFLLNNNIYEYAQLSGAEKLIVALALRLGLGAVLTKRLGISMKMLLIDEVDQSLDDENVELFEESIKKLSQEMKVMIITHDNELKTKFNRVIVVEQDENSVSTAKVSNDW